MYIRTHLHANRAGAAAPAASLAQFATSLSTNM